MSSLWTSWPGAPTPGSVICHQDDVPKGGTLCVLHDRFPILLVSRSKVVKAYVNACPHQYLPLNHRAERLLSSDGETIRCSNHNAGFSSESGEGVEGLGIGSLLDAIPVEVDAEGKVVVVMESTKVESVTA